jgi:iron complex transport system permease protein
MTNKSRNILFFTLMAAAFVVLVIACLMVGSVDIPVSDILATICGGEASKTTWTHIILEMRVPAIATAILAGAALSVSGLLMQTVFNNPLAGPSILGVSSGASLGVAVAILAMGAAAERTGMTLVGALVGAAAITLILLAMSSIVRSTMMLLIVGILISYLTSSVISLLNFFATEQGVHSYVIWGLGSFNGVDLEALPIMALLTVVALALAFISTKPLNAMLAGDRYAVNMGLNIRRWRSIILLVSAILVSVTTAYCGPIAFIGLVVPHIARLLLKTSNHQRLLPATALAGSVTSLLALFLSTAPATYGVLPINAITPIIGVPVVLYIIINRRRISYFN